MSILGVVFPDIQFIVPNIMRIGLFLTPVFWLKDGQHGPRSILYYWNPFTYFIEIIRSPILYQYIPISALCICIVIGAILWVIAILLLGTYRKKIVFLI
jgi:ABC-type polysaccharide/polyol phosphate export permease